MPLDALKERLGRIHDLEAAASLLEWDQETYMPDEGADARARQISTLQTTAHELFVDEQTGHLLDEAEEAAQGDPLSLEVSLPRVVRRDFDKARRLPSDLVAALSEATSRAKQAWKKAKTQNDFSAFAPHLERIVQLSRRKAEALGYEDTPYDALLDQYEPGMTTAELDRIFSSLRADLVPVVDVLADCQPPDTDFLHASFDRDEQWAFGLDVARDVGYDFARGRQDISAHPFTTSFSINDVRITTRLDEKAFSPAFFATLHETGHALYEQGIAPELERTPLADGASLGMHESQARLWENQVGRSSAFWKYYFPRLQDRFPEVLKNVTTDQFYRAVNRVEPSLIRVEADEVTYNLHILLRFELERALIEGSLPVDELPERWNEKMSDYLGITPDTHAPGVLQDIHWSLGALGYFPTYSLGTLMSAQIYRQAAEDIPDLEAKIGSGHFEALRDWLREHIHQYGRKLRGEDILERATGSTLRAEPWLDYIREKYGALYEVDLSTDNNNRPE